MDLQRAARSKDLIRWISIFNEVCLTGSGNADENRAEAERQITILHQKTGPDAFLVYVKAFRACVENLRRCGSTYSNLQIVTLFISHLDLGRNGHERWYTKFLDKYDPLHAALKGKEIGDVIVLSEEHYDNVVRKTRPSSNSEKTRNNNTNNNNQPSNNPKKQVETVAVTNIESPKKKRKISNVRESSSESIKKAKGSRFTDDQLTKMKAMPCKYFNSKEAKCFHGDTCRFSHVKA